MQELFCEVGQQRLNLLDRSLLDHANDGIPPRSRASGVHQRAITTSTGKLAVIWREATFTVARWKRLSPLLRSKSAYVVRVDFQGLLS